MSTPRAHAVAATADYFDLGSFHRHITTQSPDARVWFSRGLTWTYSFNHGEAVRCFEQALAHDPACAMAYWGVAFASGPNYNKKWTAFDDVELKASVSRCHHMAMLARQHAVSGLPVERALVDALAYRFPFSSAPDDFSPSVSGYANAMRTVYREFGDKDLDVIALTADALMNTHPWNLFERATRRPNLATPVLEIKDMLERALKLPDSRHHPGILHMYIHLMEMSDTPEVALMPANYLRNLVPDSGHMCHMPSHIDVLVGDYRRAIDTNMKATIADDKFFSRDVGHGFYTFYRLHNYHSLIYAAMLAGRSRVALDAVDRMEATITEDLLRVDSPPMANWMEVFKSVRIHVLIRFGMWAELKTRPVPEDKALYCVTLAMTHYGRGIACAATGDVTGADVERDLFRAAAKRVPRSRLSFPNRVVDVLKVAVAMLDGEIEYRRGRFAAAFDSLQLAVQRDDALIYAEPWGWMMPTRHPYAALLLEQGRVEEAAAVYAEDLGLVKSLRRGHQNPNNVWALHGYHECLVRLGRTAEAAVVKKQLGIAVSGADVTVNSSCFCRLEAGKLTATEKKCCSGRE
ncbi:hypothetical protein EDB81DRAFT_665106 [Dactylonectria macrodidyma]|uniref:TPR domain protein n=1 Tax=Dactylonectria macrodidyma TaxID=307937 RepID=A0A9P9DNU1_9HYPO|nr:hypothetical protein EDB81DRAFT_665106 [Dactylonectria macrodidyma]